MLPFQVPSTPLSGIELDEKEQALRKARRDASSSIGEIIKAGKDLVSPEGRKNIFDVILPEMTELFGGEQSTRAERNYSLCVHATLQASCLFGSKFHAERMNLCCMQEKDRKIYTLTSICFNQRA